MKDKYKSLDRYYMGNVKASCPASVSFIFKICPNVDPAKMGSVGVGCTVDKEVIVEVQKSSFDELIFNGTTINFPTVHEVIKYLSSTPVRVYIRSPLPLGYGFGISSASALATSFAINKLFNLKKNRLELAKIAHIAEIKNYTGLGSVATQITRGFLIKEKPGVPVHAGKLPFIGQKLYAVIVDKLETPSILKNQRYLQKVNHVAEKYLSLIKQADKLNLAQILDFSYYFSSEAGLIQNKKVKELIEEERKNGGHACMAILGYVVITDKKPSLTQNYPIHQLTISNHRQRVAD